MEGDYSPKELIEDIRRSRESGNNLIKSQNCRIEPGLSLGEIQQRLSDLPKYNKKIETSIKLEILGRQTGLVSKVIHYARSMLEDEVRPADNLISEQISRIEIVTRDINAYSRNIQDNVKSLESRYNETLIVLLAKHKESESLARELREGREIIASHEFAEDSIEGRISQAIKQRNARKKVTSSINKIRLNERAISLLKNELPILDSLSGIAEAYSFTLNEITQEADMMREHLEVVSSVYLQMMRAQRVNISLVKEIRKLFNYTNNISRALHYGATEIIQRANESSLIERSYSTNASQLTSALDKIEEATFAAFGNLESRIIKYSSDERRLQGNE